jgi:hypothetical protein
MTLLFDKFVFQVVTSYAQLGTFGLADFDLPEVETVSFSFLCVPRHVINHVMFVSHFVFCYLTK